MKSIYINGNIITLEDVTGNALVEEDGRIVEIGNLEDIDYQGMKVIDLKGKTLMPGFIDAHSHISGYASSLLQVSLKECKSIQDILDKIIKHKDQSYIVCSQYDQHMLKEKRHITRQELDDLNIDSMIVIQHQTGHMAIVNTKVLEYLHITKDTKVEGGYIDYDQGLLEENAFTANALKLPMPTLDELLKAYQKAQYIYASYGITTAQDGMIMDELTDIYQKLIDNNVLYLDVVGYPGFQAHQFIEQFKDYQDYKHEILFYLKTLLLEVKNQEPYYQEQCQNLLEILIINIIRRSKIELHISPSKKVNRVCIFVENYINEHYKENITLDHLAEAAYVNKYYLAHTFKKQKGISPINFLLEKRIEGIE